MSSQRTIPFADGMELGLGIDDLTGDVGSLAAVSFTRATPAAGDQGMEARYDTNLVQTAEQMYQSVGVNVAAEGRYGLFSASGKFSFMEESRFSSTATFLVARADIQCSFTRVQDPVPVADAQQLVRDGKQEAFRKRYGDFFIRGIKSGGEFIAIISITSSTTEKERQLAASLKASFDGLVASGSVSVDMEEKQRELRSESSIRVTIYQRGGSGDQISYASTVDEVLTRLKTFAKSVQENPKAYSVQAASYETLVFPDAPNWFDIARAQQVLEDCMRKRLQLLTARNDLEAVLLHPEHFENPPDRATLSAWSTEVTATLNALDAHTSTVINSISAAEYFAMTLPEGFAIPRRVQHSTLAVEVFTHSHYATEWQGIPGFSQKLAIGRYDNAENQLLIGNDQISSVKVPEGVGVRLYEHAWFQGKTLDLNQDTPVLPAEWNDQTSAIIVYPLSEGPPQIDYIVALDYPWVRPLHLTVGDYPDLGATALGAGTLGALLVPRRLCVTLFDQPNFQGASTEILRDTTDLGAWNNRAASLKVSWAY